MENAMFSKITNEEYRNVFILEDRNYWKECEYLCNASLDIVFTYDFALQKELESKGIEIYFLDHLLPQDVMQKNNFLIYDFFQKWHYDEKGNDIFTYKDIPFGFSLRLEFWSDYTEYIRLYIALKEISKLITKKLYIGMMNPYMQPILKHLTLKYTPVEKSIKAEANTYFFTINKWMDEQIRPQGLRGLKYKIREYTTFVHTKFMFLYDALRYRKEKQKVFIQEYHPTKDIVTVLKKSNSLKVVLSHMEKRESIFDYIHERYIPILRNNAKYDSPAKLLIDKYTQECTHRLILNDGSDITEQINEIILYRLEDRLSHTLCTLDASIKFLEKNKIDLIVLIANMGHLPTLLDCVCRVKGIPSFLIINGLLGPEYLDEAKYANYINAYSTSIQDNYFRGMSNTVALGDPRMDKYLEEEKVSIDYDTPTVVIGSSGFNSVDLNSYVAVEFDFMFDVLTALKQIKASGKKIKVILKIRPNGYKEQYESFVKEYFDGLVDSIVSKTPMKEVLRKSDFYISIYSQTLFEASCLGIPAVYYQKDTEVKESPFDGKSELVTVSTVDELVDAFDDFQNNTERYHPFLERKVMEKYVGFLDGNNLDRNIEYIYKLLEEGKTN